MTNRLPVHALDATGYVGDGTRFIADDGTWKVPTGGGAASSGPEDIRYDTIDVTAYSGQGDAGLHLALAGVSHVASDEATHPSVRRLPESWGYKYAMAFTPYPGGSDVDEDPCVAFSNDGTTWVTPTGFANPLDDQGGGTTYNSDTELVISTDGLTLSVVWRTVTSTQEILYLRSTTDGVTWTAKTAILTVTKTAENILSPAILHDGTQWVMWTVDAVPNPNLLRRRTATDLTGPWSASTACTVTGLPASRDLWHPSVIKLGSQYVGLMNDCSTGANGLDGELYLMRSTDQTTWTLNPTPVIPQALAGQYDAVYRGSLVPTFENGRLELDMWHGAWMSGATKVWGIYRRRLSQAGSGSGASTGITVQDENGTVATGVTQLDFQGATVTAAAGSGEVVVTITGSAGETHREVALSDFGSGLEPATDASGDWLYGPYPGV